MYWYRDTERNIPNTFNTDLLENKDYCIAEIIYILDNDFIKRKDLTDDVLKRVDAEIEFQRDPEEKNIKNDFAPNMRNECFSINNIISCLRHGFMQINKLPPGIADRVQYELDQLKMIMSRSQHSEIVNKK